jgi:hypothetical protein
MPSSSLPLITPSNARDWRWILEGQTHDTAWVALCDSRLTHLEPYDRIKPALQSLALLSGWRMDAIRTLFHLQPNRGWPTTSSGYARLIHDALSLSTSPKSHYCLTDDHLPFLGRMTQHARLLAQTACLRETLGPDQASFQVGWDHFHRRSAHDALEDALILDQLTPRRRLLMVHIPSTYQQFHNPLSG